MARLAGFFAAHAVWCVSDGKPLTPLVGYERPDGSRQMVQFAAELLGQAVEQGRAWMDGNPEGARRAAFVYDGYITVGARKVDALRVDARLLGGTEVSLLVAVPYRNAEHPGGFAVYRPRFLSFSGPADELEALGKAFFRGVEQHEQGARVWNAHSDQSI